VVNYDLPHVAEDYVHRIGRTGRAGAEGEAVSLVCHDQRPLMAAIERLMNRKVESRVIAGFEPGTPSQEPAEERDNRGNREQRPSSGRRPQRQQRQQQQPRQRHGQQHQQNRRHQQAQRPRANDRLSAEQEAQLAEARKRMAEEGEARRGGKEPRLGALLGVKR
jgi:ATP-dependent RNA helicase RhlE